MTEQDGEAIAAVNRAGDTIPSGDQVGGRSAIPLPSATPILSSDSPRSREASLNAILPLIALLFVLGFYMYYASLKDPTIGFGDDCAVYLTTAEALATGHGYRLINFPDAPIATFYPIGYPAVLSLLIRATPGLNAILVAGAGSTVMSFAWIVATYFFLKRCMRASYAGLSAVALGLTQRVFLSSWSIMSEWPFALLIMGAVVAVERSGGSSMEAQPGIERSPRGETANGKLLAYAALSGLLIAAAMLTRSIGVTIVIGLAAYFVYLRAWRRLVAYLTGVAIVQLPWMIWNRLNHVAGGLDGYINQYRHEASVTTPLTNFYSILSFDAPSTMFPIIDTQAWLHIGRHVPMVGLQILIGSVLVISGIAGLIAGRPKLDPVAFACVPYLVLVLIWPWEPERFCMPIFPLCIVLVVRGANALLGTWSGHDAHRSRVTLRVKQSVAALLLVSVVGSVTQDVVWLRRLKRYGTLDGAVGLPNLLARQVAFDYLEEHTPQNAVVVSSFPCATYLFTGRHTVQQPTTADKFAGTVDGLDRDTPSYVFATRRTSFAEYNFGTEFGIAPVTQYVAIHPGALTLLWADAEKDTEIYAVAATGAR